MHQSNPSAAVPGVGDLLLILCPAVGHFHVFFLSPPPGICHIFSKIVKSPGGWPGEDGHAWI